MRITHDKIRISQLKALIKKYVLRALLKDKIGRASCRERV